MLHPYRILTVEQATHNTSFRYSDHMIRGALAVTALVGALMAALPATALADLETRNGSGTLRASASGFAYGAVGKGSIWLLDFGAVGRLDQDLQADQRLQLGGEGRLTPATR